MQEPMLEKARRPPRLSWRTGFCLVEELGRKPSETRSLVSPTAISPDGAGIKGTNDGM
jgi:hypothetical protein